MSDPASPPDDPTTSDPTMPVFQAPQPLKTPRLGWGKKPPRSDPGPDVSSPDALTDDGSASGPDSPVTSELPHDEPSTRSGSSPASSRASAAAKAQLREVAAAAITGATTLAHTSLARDELEQEAGIWLADESDVDAIATPAASLMSRHTGGTDLANPDIADAIAMAIGLAVYVSKQWNKLAVVRRLRAAGAAPPEGFQPVADFEQETTP